MSWVSRFRKASTDRLVGLASGSMPVKALDEKHTAFRLIIVVAIVTFGASGWLLWRTIDINARFPKAANTNSSNGLTTEQIATLKNRDTDGDGLNDYDELYSYHSSPYLFSSASDGVSDGEKVAKGVNPNCPLTGSCGAISGVVTTNTTVTNTNSGQLSAEFLRSALIAAGAPAATVNQADDATLLSMYNQAVSTGGTTTTNTNTAVANTNSATNTNSTNTSTTTNTSTIVENLSDLTPSQIRALLIKNGADAATLSSVDDATLKATFEEAISQSQTSN